MTSLALKHPVLAARIGTLWPYAAVIAAILSFALGTTVAKSLFPLIGAESAVTLRVVLSALIMAVIFQPWKAKRTGAHLWLTVLFGLVLGAMNLTFYLSLRTLPIGIALGIEFIGPLTVALLGARRLSHVAWVGLAGLGLVLLLPLTGQAIDPVGAGFAALAAVFWALYIVLGKKLSNFDPGRSLALGMAAAILVVAPVGLGQMDWALVLTPTVLGLALLVAILSSALPYSLEMAALKHLPRRTFGVMLSLDPAVGALAGLLILGEQLGGLQWLAIGCIVAASVGAAATSREPTPKSAIPTDAPA
ncbi:MAG TPA: EamA family transporter [Brevundimonas sp.]|uniref:EamA family transporter n=1 Tax=Brevundimonas sp. TaxID=1871086 RepID=UPI002C0665BB|nr:EamA family transporter [Brevundimonas sp.]HRH20886.1 EamA family transporter [Brevundimonas sp.]